VDFSKKFEKEGLQTFVFSTGKFKGMGMMGSELTDDQKAFLQNRVENLNTFFEQAVMEARGFSQEKIDELFDGSFGLAQEALSKGLIDEIESFDDALAKLEQRINESSEVSQNTFEKAQNTNSTKNNNSIVEDQDDGATMDEQIKQNSKEIEEMENPTNVSEMQTAYPTLCAELEKTAVENALEKEQSRVSDWVSFSDVDAGAVKDGIDSGKAISIVQATALQAKRSDPAFKAALEDESPEVVETPSEEASEATDEAKEVASIIANAEKYN